MSGNQVSSGEVTEPPEALIAFLTGYFDIQELLDWVTDFGSKNPEIDRCSAVFELAWLNRKVKHEESRVEKLMRRFVKESDPSFEEASPHAEKMARAMFENRLRDYLEEKCQPWDVCRMVQPIEQLFDYPVWLGDMYNQCDWIEPGAKPVDCRHLEAGIQEHLAEYGE